MKQYVEITYNGIKQDDSYEKIIENVITQCFKNEKMEQLNLYVSVTLTVPNEIQKINLKYRNIDRATDVLSFPMFEKEEIENIIKSNYGFEDCLGDIVISIPKVQEQANEYGHSFERELSYMCVHGFYHLMGYDHIVDSDKKIMRAKEDEVLNILHITRE